LEHREIEHRTECGVLTAVYDSKQSIQLNFPCSSAVVHTSYTCVVVAQKGIEAKG
jgi:hypothetical protein